MPYFQTDATNTMIRIIVLLFLWLSFESQTLARDFNLKPFQATLGNAGFPAIHDDFLGLRLPKNGVKWPVRKGSLWLNLSTNRWLYAYPKFGSITGLPILVSADHSFDDHWTIGAYGGYYSPTYNEPFGSDRYDSHLKSYVGGLRLSFHFADVFNKAFHEVLNLQRWDLYTSLSAGVVHYTWKVDNKYINHRDFTPVTFPSVGLVAGVRFLIFPRLAVFGEIGKGVFGYVGFGLSAKIVK